MNIETELRDVLAHEATAVDLPDDPWDGFRRRETRHRRSRRIRIAAAGIVLAALAGLQSGLVPMPGWAPGVAIASADDALVQSPTRGSLAGDRAWLAGMRAQIKDVQDPGELWRVTDRNQIRILYAGDVGQTRLMLAWVPLRFGFVKDSTLTWYTGPAGAAPGQMEESSRFDGGQQVATIGTVSSEQPGYAVIVGPQGSTASISNGLSYTAAGTVQHNPPVSGPPGSGVAQLALPATNAPTAITGTVTQGGRTFYDNGNIIDGTGIELPSDEQYDAVLDPALGTRTLDKAMLRRWLQDCLAQSRTTLGTPKVTIPWVGTVHGQQAALITIQDPGHGVLAFAFHGRADSYRQDLRLLLPAAGAGNRPLAWRMRADGGDGRTAEVQVVAPPGTASLMLTPQGGEPVGVTLDAAGHGVGTLEPNTPGTVAAYASDGTVFAATPVPLFDDGGVGLGESPQTRIVP